MVDMRVGIIGCGNMGSLHAQQLSMQGVHVRALADPMTERVEPLKQQVGAEYVVDDGRALIDDKNIDAVVIATRHDLHVPQAIAAAQAGKHLFIEKPLALTIEDCEAIEREVTRAGVKAMCGFQARFSPFCTTLRERIGVPLALLATFDDPLWPADHWANDPKQGGGNVLSQGCHMFDMMGYFAQSDPAVVHAEGGNLQHPTLPITDSVVATIRFRNGVVAAAVVGDFGRNPALSKASYHLWAGAKAGTLVRYYTDPLLQFWGTEPDEVTAADLLPDELKDDPITDWRSPAQLWLHGYPQQIEAFVNWLTNDERHPDTCDVPQAAMATRTAVRCIQSIAEARRVDV